ncbi:hypothetical protein QBC40DRAFT_260727 [Triangularia verruculosa]|uniref:Uncharacterized protein n=1 Tax=Triangularia verruculosa TaxID=2587418 RepID=A0AAN7AZL3_9PEZI|nr:hypothetical protein QBC40DRAFT_260727 [Triangularia verruculosa]
MASPTDILDKLSQLSVLNVGLTKDIKLLEEGRNQLELRFKTDLSRLNQAIRELPAVVDVLVLDKPPPLKLTSEGGLLVALRTADDTKAWYPSSGVVQTVIADICSVEVEMLASRKDAMEKKIATAELACKAAEHMELCSSVGRTVTNSLAQTQHSLETTNSRIASTQQQIAENNRMSAEMANQAQVHQQRVEESNLLFWTTFWIPVVNFVTIPVSMAWEAENKALVASCHATAATLAAEMATKIAEKNSLDTTRSELEVALNRLNVACNEAEERARHATEVRNQARVLMDQYSIVTTQVRDVLQALDFMGEGGNISAESWDEARFLGLQALKGMLVTLREKALLAPECLEVAKKVEGLKELQIGVGRLQELDF